MSPLAPVKAIQISMHCTLARATMNTPHHSSRPCADPQAHIVHETDNRIHVGSTVRTEQSLPILFSIDRQQYRTAANVLSSRHSILTQQMLELDAGFPMHYTETLEELLHSLWAWTTSQCPSKKSPGDHVDGGWDVVIHHTEKTSKTKGGRQQLHCYWHKESRTKDSNAGMVTDMIALCWYHWLLIL